MKVMDKDQQRQGNWRQGEQEGGDQRRMKNKELKEKMEIKILQMGSRPRDRRSREG